MAAPKCLRVDSKDDVQQKIESLRAKSITINDVRPYIAWRKRPLNDDELKKCNDYNIKIPPNENLPFVTFLSKDMTEINPTKTQLQQLFSHLDYRKFRDAPFASRHHEDGLPLFDSRWIINKIVDTTRGALNKKKSTESKKSETDSHFFEEQRKQAAMIVDDTREKWKKLGLAHMALDYPQFAGTVDIQKLNALKPGLPEEEVAPPADVLLTEDFELTFSDEDPPPVEPKKSSKRPKAKAEPEPPAPSASPTPTRITPKKPLTPRLIQKTPASPFDKFLATFTDPLVTELLSNPESFYDTIVSSETREGLLFLKRQKVEKKE